MKITTNNQYRPFLYWHELTSKEQGEFDYERVEEDTFFRYKGWVYSLSDIMLCPAQAEEFKGWTGYHSDSYYSGVVIKLSDCGDMVKVGHYLS